MTQQRDGSPKTLYFVISIQNEPAAQSLVVFVKSFLGVRKVLKSFYFGAAIATLALIPATAQAAAPGSAIVAATQGAAGAVDNFYRARGNAPLWFANGRESAAAVELVGLLKRATARRTGQRPADREPDRARDRRRERRPAR